MNHSLSDLHLGSFQSKEQLAKAVELVNQESPDLIFFTGDLVNNYPSEASPYVDILDQLTAKYGKFAVLGNHDYSDYIGLNTATPEGQRKWNENLEAVTFSKNLVSIYYSNYTVQLVSLVLKLIL